MGCGASKTPSSKYRSDDPPAQAVDVAKLRQSFDAIDSNGDGKLSRQEIVAAFEKLQMKISDEELMQVSSTITSP